MPESGGQVADDGKAKADLLQLPVSWFPVVRHNNTDEKTGTWMEALTQPPAVVATGVDFAHQIMRGRREHTLRERLGVPAGTIVFIHGQVRPDALKKVWDGRDEFIGWLKDDAAVDGVITPQFETDDAPDLDRAFEWFRATTDAEFAYPVFQHPGAQPKPTSGLLQECYDFAESEGVNLIAFSVGKDRGRGGLIPTTVRDHKLSRANYPEAADFLHFGTSTALKMKMAAKLLGYFDGEHGVTFSNVVASTAAAFYLRLPERASAPPGNSKGEVFKHNLEGYVALADKVLGKSAPSKKLAAKRPHRRSRRTLRSRHRPR